MFDSSKKLDCNHLPPYDFFYQQTEKSKSFGEGLLSVQENYGIWKSGISLSRKENYALLEKFWKMEKMKTFRDFLRWYNNHDVVPTLQAMKKMMEFYHDQKIDMLKLGCTVPNLANICLHKSTDRSFTLSSKLKKTCIRKYEVK